MDHTLTAGVAVGVWRTNVSGLEQVNIEERRLILRVEGKRNPQLVLIGGHDAR